MFDAKTKDKAAKTVFWLSATMIIFVLLAILLYVFIRGIGVISPEFLFETPSNNWTEGGIWPALEGTIFLVSVALLFAGPLGVLTSVYLVEFREEDNLTRLIRISADSLNAVPSIVFGIFGYSLFVFYLSDFTGGPTILSGGLTLGFMILPTIIRTAEVALRSVPQEEKLGSYALGATKLQTIRRVCLPNALPGIITGVILGFGRVAGETAPIVFMVSISPVEPQLQYLLFSSFNALTTLLYYLTSEAISISRAFGIAFVLLAIVLICNYGARLLNRRLSRNIKR